MHRGRAALELVEAQGLTAQQASRRLGLSTAKIERLIEAERSRLDLANHQCDKVPVADIQRLVDDHAAKDPTFTHATIARRAQYKSRIHFERALGYAPHSATTKRGKHYPAKYAMSIDVNRAAVIVRELGIAPHEVPGL